MAWRFRHSFKVIPGVRRSTIPVGHNKIERKNPTTPGSSRAGEERTSLKGRHYVLCIMWKADR